VEPEVQLQLNLNSLSFLQKLPNEEISKEGKFEGRKQEAGSENSSTDSVSC
jgi:hypothetical protein